MDVYDAPFKCTEKFPFQHPHETSEHDQIYLRSPQGLNHCMFGCFLKFRAKFTRRNKLLENIPFAGVCQNPRRLHIAQYYGDFSGNFPGSDGISNGDKVRAFARTKDAQTKWITHSD